MFLHSPLFFAGFEPVHFNFPCLRYTDIDLFLKSGAVRLQSLRAFSSIQNLFYMQPENYIA